MSLQLGGGTRGRTNRFVPRLEALEDRLVMNCNFDVGGGGDRLTIENNNGRTEIFDDGTNGAANITVNCDNGQEIRTFDGIRFINFNGSAGNETVVYKQTGILLFNRKVTANLDAGSDQFHAKLDFGVGDLGRGGSRATLQIIGDGGAGSDGLQLTGDNNPRPTRVAAGNFVRVTFLGGADNDSINADYTTEVKGKVAYSANGGEGNDNLRADLYGNRNSHGRITGALAGGGGSNNMVMGIRPGDYFVYIGQIHGSSDDTCIGQTPNVFVSC